MPKKKLTVNSILTKSAINEVLDDMGRQSKDMEEIIVIYTTPKHFHCNTSVGVARLILLLEQVKHMYISDEGEADD